MGRYVFKLADVGEGMAEAEITHWHVAAGDSIEEEVRAAGKKAEALGTLDRGPLAPVRTMFEDVYKEMPWYLERQRKEQEG